MELGETREGRGSSQQAVDPAIDRWNHGCVWRVGQLQRSMGRGRGIRLRLGGRGRIRFCMEGKIPVPFGVPVETRDVSWRHDRRQDMGSCAARMRNRGTRRNRGRQRQYGLSRGQADCRQRSKSPVGAGTSEENWQSGGRMILPPETLIRRAPEFYEFFICMACARCSR